MYNLNEESFAIFGGGFLIFGLKSRISKIQLMMLTRDKIEISRFLIAALLTGAVIFHKSDLLYYVSLTIREYVSLCRIPRLSHLLLLNVPPEHFVF